MSNSIHCLVFDPLLPQLCLHAHLLMDYRVQSDVRGHCCVWSKATFHVIPVWVVGQKTKLGEAVLRDPA